MSSPTTPTRRGRAPIHPLRLLGIAFLIAMIGFAFAVVSQFAGPLAAVGIALFYLAVPVALVGVIAWGTLIGIRYYDHSMRDT